METNAWFLIASVLAACSAGLHAWGGELKVLRPLRRTEGVRMAPLLEAVWHLVTWQLILATATLALLGVFPKAAATPTLSILSLGLFVGAGVVVLMVSRRSTGSWRTLPQAWIFLALAFFTAGGLAAQTGVLSPFAGLARATFPWLVAVVLLALALLHAAWAAGSPWPAADRTSLGLLVAGVSQGIGGRGIARSATVMVALALLLASLAVLAATGHLPRATVLFPARALALAAWTLTFVLAFRGVAGYFDKHLRTSIRGTPYARWNERLYSPLCLALSALLAFSLSD